jgi:hypothetical protein
MIIRTAKWTPPGALPEPDRSGHRHAWGEIFPMPWTLRASQADKSSLKFKQALILARKRLKLRSEVEPVPHERRIPRS